ncbi:SDR family NAD(P)-dependent oxidoreductase [Streptomyces sp. ST2-7A]|uniref:SDR family NAD(P)-dependent oxidoreductase n=1 Tax=Streptomyces sp. ST2-7A TaxID=2907214 RepID=UPI001F1A53BB|nr:SDR family oxidoreductase [Streptomyces sp. ST2-7A]MCE7081995.1 SDR family oxidoreductase [Streptomyces sp. ST2-7A]
MLLERKTAVLHGAGGPIGGAVARAFAREGARVVLTGRTREPLDAVATDIRSRGGTADIGVLNALDESDVDAFVDDIAADAGSVDVSFNLIGFGDVQQPLMEIEVEDFTRPVTTLLRSHFLTTRAAARHMTRRGSGVVLAFGGGGPHTLPNLGGLKVAFDALEGLRRQWACELGPHGVRVITVKTGGIPESIPTDFEGREAIEAQIVAHTLLRRAATLEDVGNAAVFAASDMAAAITAADLNITCGGVMD